MSSLAEMTLAPIPQYMSPEGKIRAIGARLPYDLGVAEANAALYALLGKPVPLYISIAALGVKQDNLQSASEMIAK